MEETEADPFLPGIKEDVRRKKTGTNSGLLGMTEYRRWKRTRN
jgi:hypothetical protein